MATKYRKLTDRVRLAGPRLISKTTSREIRASVRFLLNSHSPLKLSSETLAKISVISPIFPALNTVMLLAFCNKNTLGQERAGLLFLEKDSQADRIIINPKIKTNLVHLAVSLKRLNLRKNKYT